MIAVQPIFEGQDEARHYNTIQYLAEEQNILVNAQKNERLNDIETRDKDNFDTYNFTEEIQKTAVATDVNILRSDSFNTAVFSNLSEGIHESLVNSRIWKSHNTYTEPDIAEGGRSLYHKIFSRIEGILTEYSILIRFYFLRIISVILGTFAVFICYSIAKNIGFSSKVSLILTALLSFQPKFSIYLTGISYDTLLIPMFFLFTYSSVRTLKEGPTWKNFALLIGSMVIAIETKPTGYILVVPFITLVTYLLYEKVRLQKKSLQYSVYAFCLFLFISVVFYFSSHFLESNLSLSNQINSIGNYLSKTLTFGKFIMPSDTYWGILGWTNNAFLWTVPWGILLLELLALFGLGLLFFSKTFSQSYPSFLPAKKYIIFLIGMIVALQLGVRTADWHGFSQIGSMKFGLGTPGRYFLPNLSAHILLMATGLGALLAYTKKERYFETILLGLLILMFSLMIYLTFNALILRFYF